MLELAIKGIILDPMETTINQKELVTIHSIQLH